MDGEFTVVGGGGGEVEHNRNRVPVAKDVAKNMTSIVGRPIDL